jgi:hypothetical protein
MFAVGVDVVVATSIQKTEVKSLGLARDPQTAPFALARTKAGIPTEGPDEIVRIFGLHPQSTPFHSPLRPQRCLDSCVQLLV